MCDFHNFGLIFIGQCQRSEKKFQTTLILAFDVIVQPSKIHFWTFSSETKIMKTIHCASHMEYKLLKKRRQGDNFTFYH